MLGLLGFKHYPSLCHNGYLKSYYPGAGHGI